MRQQLVINKYRTNTIIVSLGYDVSEDIITSDIRVSKDPTSDLIASWDVSFEDDGVDGQLILTLDDSVTSEITKTIGYMDLERLSAGEPLSVFDEPLEVVFRNVVTAVVPEPIP